VSGYYEWQDTPDGKQPWYFTARDGSQALTVAGLWDEWKDRQIGERLKSCTMIITEPNAFVAEVHDRMPALRLRRILTPGSTAARMYRCSSPRPTTSCSDDRCQSG
jgi:putative SOS response-associated peptidase YedK